MKTAVICGLRAPLMVMNLGLTRVGWMLDERLPEVMDDRVHQRIPPKFLMLVIANNRS